MYYAPHQCCGSVLNIGIINSMFRRRLIVSWMSLMQRLCLAEGWQYKEIKFINVIVLWQWVTWVCQQPSRENPCLKEMFLRLLTKEKHLFLINVKWHLIKSMWHKTIKCKTVVKANYLENWLCTMLASFITDL